MSDAGFTPREIVSELDRFIIGQKEAKRAVAIALRNRWRRRNVPRDLRDEVMPKNIIMIGPTGVGKTEIARRLSRLARAPFIKVEASKFTEVGYVGRDVESMIRDLTRSAIGMVQEEETQAVQVRAMAAAENRLLDMLVGPAPRSGFEEQGGVDNTATRDKMREKLRRGELDEREVPLQVADRSAMPMMEIFSSGAGGMEEMDVNIKDMLGNMFNKKTRERRVSVAEAREILVKEEAQKLVDMDNVVKEALRRVQDNGIVFIDEIDKVAGRESSQGPDVSREGVQRDLLPLVEGTSVNTKYGPVATDHILFVAAGAFHVSKPSDLIPELQGRFPIRVELHSLGREEFVRILSEPENSLVRQYVAMMATEGLELAIDESAVAEIARVAVEMNGRLQDIGARRLITVLERVLDELSFDATEMSGKRLVIDREYVTKHLEDVIADEDLSRYVL